MRIVATAGHVDHGKSTLVRALTGMETDRLDQERARGLTIDLGFAWVDLAGPGDPDRTVAFVDVPGHERFLATMVAGAGVVADALLVVAADEGWSAQSTEHVEVLDLLGVRGVAVAVTKAGRVDADRVREVVDDVRARIAGTSLADAPVVVTDAVDGTGLEDLVGVLRARTDQPVGTVPAGRGRLWVDRAFAIHGAGTVVTGSWWGDALAVGDEVVVLPGGRRARVRGLQSLGRPVEVATPGSRLAVNLVGVSHDEVARGDVVAPLGVPWTPTTTVSATVRVLPGREVGRRGAWHLHVGTAVTTVRVAPLLLGPITPDAPGPARLELSDPLPLCTGDRLVLRESGRRATVAGVTVLDPDPPPRPRGRTARREQAEALGRLADASDDQDRVRGLVALHDGVHDARAVAAALGRAAAPDVDGVVPVGTALVDADLLARWTSVVVAAVEEADDVDGLDLVRADASLAATSCPATLHRAVVEHAVDTGRLVRHGSVVVLPGSSADHAAARRRHLDAIEHELATHPFTPPNAAALAERVGATTVDLQALVAAGRAIRVHGVVFGASAVDEAVGVLRHGDLAARPFTAAEARTAWATTRRYAVPLLEHLAATGRTTFDGHHHRLVDAPPPRP